MSRRGFVRVTALGLPAMVVACNQTAPAGSSSPSGTAVATARVAPTQAQPTQAPATQAAAAAPPVTAVATPAGGAASNAPTVAGVRLPTYIPTQGARPGLPPSPDGMISPGYMTYPAAPFKAVSNPPGDGSDVTIFTSVNAAPPSPVDQNPAWQGLNAATGANLLFTFVPFADISTKFQTLIAGGELPDIACTVTSAYASLLPEFFASSAADLTPYLSGDAIKDYPNLAALPTRSWKTTIYNGKISAVPQQLPPYFWWPWVHQELLDAAGLAKPTTSAEFKQMAVAMTRPQQGVYGLMSQGGFDKAYDVITGYYSSMFGAPNVWAVDSNGTFTHQYETQPFRDAVAYARDLYAAGVFDPDVANLNTNTARIAFTDRKSAFAYNAINTDYWTVGKDADPPYKIELLPPFTPDGGGKPTFYFGRPNLGIAILKKAPEERIKMLLRILDFMAAPFGSEEYLLMYFGVKDVDYQLDDKGNPVPTDIAKNHLLPLSSVVRGPDTLYHPTFPGYAALVQGYQQTLAAVGIEDASIGYFSRTWATQGVPMIQPFGDGVTDIITGRRDMSDYDDLLKNWRAAGGDTSKAEFQQAYASGG